VKIPVGVAYGVNVENVRKMLLRDLQPLITKNAAGKYLVDNKQGFQVIFDDFGESSVDLYVVCWVLVEEKAAFIAKVKEVIYNTLNKNKIEIPFPQRDVYVRHVEMPSTKTKTKKAESPIPETEPEVKDEIVAAERKTVTPKKRGQKPKKQVETNQNVNNDKQSV
jgi:small-conductance mechanosensitive channel